MGAATPFHRYCVHHLPTALKWHLLLRLHTREELNSKTNHKLFSRFNTPQYARICIENSDSTSEVLSQIQFFDKEIVWRVKEYDVWLVKTMKCTEIG